MSERSKRLELIRRNPEYRIAVLNELERAEAKVKKLEDALQDLAKCDYVLEGVGTEDVIHSQTCRKCAALEEQE